MTISIIFISFFLDGICSNLLQLSPLLYPLFSLLSLVIIFPYYKKRNIKKYYITSLLLGLIYDVVYTNTLFLNMLFFFLLSILISLLYNLLNNTMLNAFLISFFLIVCYRLFTYLVLLFTDIVTFDINVLFTSIYSSLIVNIIYLLLFYYITKIISKKCRIYSRK